MKKIVTLSAIVAMSLSSYVFAADNAPVPPPKYPLTHDGQPPRHDDKNPQHRGSTGIMTVRRGSMMKAHHHDGQHA
jgi:hypothetical protein